MIRHRKTFGFSKFGFTVLFYFVVASQIDVQITRAQPDPSPDSHAESAISLYRIAFSSDRDGDFEIYTADENGANQQRLTVNTANDGMPAISPDGTQIAFNSDRSGIDEVYVMRFDGSDLQRVTFDGGYWPAWSPDGKNIAFTADADGENVEIFMINTDGTQRKQLTFNSGQAGSSCPTFSPDGETIAFDSMRNGQRQICIMNTDGSHQRQLTASDGGKESPVFAPDGKMIAYWKRYDPCEIRTVDLQGDETTIYKGRDSDRYQLSFRPDGSKIAFAAAYPGNDSEFHSIFIVPTDGSRQKTELQPLISVNDFHCSEPSWGKRFSTEETTPSQTQD